MNILIKFPTRGRPDIFLSTLDLYYNLCSDLNKTQFLISIDEDDETMNNDDMLLTLSSYKNLSVFKGISKSKIDAVNRDIEFVKDWDILLLASDDMIPQIKGYDQIIRDNMILNYPDLDGILWFNDGYQGNSLNTLSILGKKYYDRFNYIYHKDYKSVWSDNEFMLVGKILNRQTYIDQVIIKHDHPVFVKGKKDIIHKKNSEDFDSDYKTFLLRQSNNFYL